jgi:sugar lactone lactonase YvrE
MKPFSLRLRPGFSVLAALLFFAATAAAVTPGQWTHATEADFAGGEFDSTVVNSLGEIGLARQVTVLAPSSLAPAVVSALAPAGKTIYFASGGSGAIYRYRDGKTERFANTPGATVCSLLWTGKELLAGVGGKEAGIHAVDRNGGVTRRWSDPNVKYVWAMVPGEGGTIYAATGAQGAVYSVDAEGKAEALYRTGPLAKNVLCLARAKSGLLYAGTDQDGLVIEIDPAAKTGRAILDAEEKEIAAIVVDEKGIYAATSDAAKAAADGAVEPAATDGGRPHPATAPARKLSSSGPATQPSPLSMSSESAAAKARPIEDSTKLAAPPPRPRIRLVSPPRPGVPAPAAPAAEEAGNAVYCIRPDGLVTTVLRKPLTILAMAMRDGRLILGTGNGGCVYSASLDGQDVARIADTDAKQITCLAVTGDGRVLFGTANKGCLGSLGRDLAKEGTFTSKALDAKQIAKWGTIRVAASAGGASGVTFATRSGNIGEPNDGAWIGWSVEQPVGDGFAPIASPAGRFLQYRLKLTGGKPSPAVRGVEVIYQVGNLPPVVSAVTFKPSSSAREGEQEQTDRPQAFRHVTITATDVNEDQLIYSLFFRQSGSESWIKIADKLEAPNYVWDTRSVGDGSYQLRAVVSDSPSNPRDSAVEGWRVSSTLEVDNTAPVVSLAASSDDGAASLTGQSVDAGSRIVSIHYAVDSNTDWTAVLPEDGIADSPKEGFQFRVEDLSQGAHRIAVKVADLYGNTGYATVTVTVGK